MENDDDLEATRVAADMAKLERDTGFDVYSFGAELHSLRESLVQLKTAFTEMQGKVDVLSERIARAENDLAGMKNEFKAIKEVSEHAAKLLGTIDLLLGAMEHGRKW